MKPSTILAVFAPAALTTAWNLDVYGADGRHANFTGTQYAE